MAGQELNQRSRNCLKWLSDIRSPSIVRRSGVGFGVFVFTACKRHSLKRGRQGSGADPFTLRYLQLET